MADDIKVTAGTDRPSAPAQIQQIIDLVRAEKGEDIRLRLPLSIFDPEGRNYTPIRDAFWNLRLPAESTDVAQVEELIEALGKCIVALASEGPAAVIQKLAAQPYEELFHERDE
jgi:hypothetical protein